MDNTNWAAIWSAIAATCSALAGITSAAAAWSIWMTHRRNYINSARPDVELGDWSLDQLEGGFQLSIGTVTNFGSGPAFDLKISVKYQNDRLLERDEKLAHRVVVRPEQMLDINAQLFIPFSGSYAGIVAEPADQNVSVVPATVSHIASGSELKAVQIYMTFSDNNSHKYGDSMFLIIYPEGWSIEGNPEHMCE